MKKNDIRHPASIMLAGATLSACASQSSIGAPGATATIANLARASSPSPIQHIVLLVQEDRTYNDLFVTTKVGCKIEGSGRHEHAVKVRLKEVSLAGVRSLTAGYRAYLTAYNHGTGCGWNIIEGAHGPEGLAPYVYVNQSQIKPYLRAAANYVLADRMFQTQGSLDFTAHQDLIRGGTEISKLASVIDVPDDILWGCPAPAGTRTDLITIHSEYERNEGPFPCFTYATLATLLDAKRITWKYYTPEKMPFWDAFFAIKAVWSDPIERRAHVSSPETKVLTDIRNGTLPAMSWVIPSVKNSDASFTKEDDGPSWVASVVDEVGESQYWNSTAVIVVWDSWGGYFDPILPSHNNQGGFGYRVPMLVIAPYVAQGEIAHTTYSFGSIVRFIEDTWGLGRLGTTDETSASIGDIFDFKQSPRPFIPI